MKKEYGFEKVYWEDVRDEVKAVNPTLSKIIDKISPNKNYPLIRARYQFGDLIVNHGITQLPTPDGELLPLSDSRFRNSLKDQFSYSPIPLTLTLKNANEIFLEASSRIVPLNLIYPGFLLGLFESLDFIFGRPSAAQWNVSAGARSLFTLPKLNEVAGFKRLKIAYGLSSELQPRQLTDHWRIFYEIARHQYFEQDWGNEVLFFSKNWLTEHDNHFDWLAFRDYLFKHAWHQAQFAISKIDFGLVWECVANAISARNLKPIPYLVDQVKHIMLIAAGRWPGFKPADMSNQIAPTDCLQKIITEIYSLKKYIPSMMHISSLEQDATKPLYYSLACPTLLEGSAKNKSSTSTLMIDLRDIKHLVDTIKPALNKSNNLERSILDTTKFDYFHVEPDKYGEILPSSQLLDLDKNLLIGKNKYSDREFCTTSQFWRGCIRITKK